MEIVQRFMKTIQENRFHEDSKDGANLLDKLDEVNKMKQRLAPWGISAVDPYFTENLQFKKYCQRIQHLWMKLTNCCFQASLLDIWVKSICTYHRERCVPIWLNRKWPLVIIHMECIKENLLQKCPATLFLEELVIWKEQHQLKRSLVCLKDQVVPHWNFEANSSDGLLQSHSKRSGMSFSVEALRWNHFVTRSSNLVYMSFTQIGWMKY